MKATTSVNPSYDEKLWAAEPPTLGKRAEEAAMRWAGRLSCLPHSCLGSHSEQRPGVLTYHRIAAPVAGLPKPLHNVTPEDFERQLGGLLSRGWQILPLNELLDAKAGQRSLPRKAAVITFDDGFESVYRNAWPVLLALQIPFTIFLCTEYLDRPEPFPFDLWGLDHQSAAPPSAYRPLTKAQCCEMLESGLMQIGAHTHSHEDFRGRPEEFSRDLSHCVQILRDHFSLTDVPFAYPYGSPRKGFASSDLQTAARETGVTCGLTTQAILVDLSSDPFCWGRFNVFSWDTGTTLAAKLGGWYSWSNRLRGWCSLPRTTEEKGARI